MTNPNPSVTVIVPCFNTAPYLLATLKSVEAQTFQNFEVIMVDDGSTDGTLTIMQDFAARHAHCKVIPLLQNQGIVAARNAALLEARGEYIAMLDGDDIWTPDALSLRLNLAQRNPTVAVVASDFAWFTDEPAKKPVGRVGLGPRARNAFAKSFETQQVTVLDNAFELVATTHFAWTGATLVRRDAMTEIANFDPEFTGPEDTLLWLRLANKHPFLFAPKITAYYRQRDGSLVTQNKGPKELHYLKVLDWIKRQQEFAGRINAINRLAAECHHVCVQHYRRSGNVSGAFNHALNAIKIQPQIGTYWRTLAAVVLDALRNRPQQPTGHS